MTVDGKNIIEVMVGFLGIIGAISSFAIYLATLSQKNSMNTEFAKIAARFQRMIDRNKLEVGVLKMRIRDLESFSQRQGFTIRGDFPMENLPSENSDFIENG